MATVISSWREARAQKRAVEDARRMVGEARRILRKKSYRIPDSVGIEIETANQAVESAIAAGDHDRLQREGSSLEAKIDQHLAFARKSSVREYGESIFVAIFIALLLRAFVIEAFQIPSGSMIPTLEIGDHIFVSKFSYGFVVPFSNKKILQYAEPKRGDVIVFKFPLSTDTDYIKRVVAVAGDTIEVRRNEVIVNGKPYPRQLLNDKPCRQDSGSGDEPTGPECERWLETIDGRSHVALQNANGNSSDLPPRIIPAGHVFCMGDNRDNSNDSRVWGTVPEELIKGRALVIWWSRRPIAAELSGGGLGRWVASIRWSRFFQLVK